MIIFIAGLIPHNSHFQGKTTALGRTAAHGQAPGKDLAHRSRKRK